MMLYYRTATKTKIMSGKSLFIVNPNNTINIASQTELLFIFIIKNQFGSEAFEDTNKGNLFWTSNLIPLSHVSLYGKTCLQDVHFLYPDRHVQPPQLAKHSPSTSETVFPVITHLQKPKYFQVQILTYIQGLEKYWISACSSEKHWALKFFLLGEVACLS